MAFDLQVACSLAREGACNGEALRFMRKVLGLDGRELASLLSLTPETVSRIEKGRVPVDVRTAALIGAMVLDKLEDRTDTLKRLHALKHVENVREERIAGYREQLKTLPPGPERGRVEAAVRDWLTMGPKRRASLARLFVTSRNERGASHRRHLRTDSSP